MIINKKHKLSFVGIICLTAVIASSCSSKGGSSSVDDSSSKAASAAPKVTLQTEDYSVNESSKSESSLADESSVDSENEGIIPQMWEVTSDDGTKVTMLGSMHALKDEVYPLPARISDAYNSADVLAVECDVSTITTNFSVQLKQYDNLYYKDGTSLEDHLESNVYNGISEFLQTNDLNIEDYKAFKPWYVSSMLDSFVVEQSGLKSTEGIDSYFLELAHSESKEIYEVESLDFQMDLLINFSDDIYNMLMSSYNKDSNDPLIAQLLDTYEAWKTGDTEFFNQSADVEYSISQAEKEGQKLSEKDIAAYKEYNDKMLTQRNITMAQAVETLLEGDKDVFYVVGAAHFAGDDGIISLLEDNGYTVNPI